MRTDSNTMFGVRIFFLPDCNFFSNFFSEPETLAELMSKEQISKVVVVYSLRKVGDCQNNY